MTIKSKLIFSCGIIAKLFSDHSLPMFNLGLTFLAYETCLYWSDIGSSSNNLRQAFVTVHTEGELTLIVLRNFETKAESNECQPHLVWEE